MKNFNKSSDFGGDRGRDRHSMHQAVCTSCGKTCEVPFKPTGDKPVYCNDCFKNKRGDRGDQRGGGRDFGRPSFGDKRMHQAICASCGKTCEVPFRPTGDKPIYCSDCFGKSSKAPKAGGNLTNDQFGLLNAKLDKILQALGSNASAQSSKPVSAKTKEKRSAGKKTKAAKKPKKKKT